ncbi:potassium channel family protein [Cellulomonas soli]|uniref:potassium channel family protein n=1 Tax=Cellulomonas soli TaxID=931535 RepID=UPI003F838EF6
MTLPSEPSLPALPLPLPRREAWRLGALMMLRVAVSVSLLLAAYFLIPTNGAARRDDVPWLVVELGVFAVVVGIQVPAVVRAKHPVLRAVEALAVVIALFLLIFARIYLETSLSDPSAFNEPLDATAALYFTVTTFATVGFGDLVARSAGMRTLVTVQMLLDLVVLGAVIRLLLTAARRGVARRVGEIGRRDDAERADRDQPG